MNNHKIGIYANCQGTIGLKYMSKSINLVLYSHGEPFNSTKKKLIKTINNYTNRNVIIHDYDLDRIMKSSWYNKIKDLPKINGGKGRRDGYYNCWKSFIVNEVYENMNDSDILYYVDSSKYFKYGFTENVDKLFDIALKEGIIAGSVGKDIRNNSFECCNNINIWNKIIPNNDNSDYLNKMHVLNSWFILVKNNINTNFLNDWKYWSVYKDNEFINPLVTYHHTADQSIFNILVYKYNFKVFYNKLIGHNENKDRNVVLKTINNNINSEQYFINL
tara:strand:+ start:549 stop:1373 length:825 start_codon:yes stop_codon:yes gene_type:complete